MQELDLARKDQRVSHQITANQARKEEKMKTEHEKLRPAMPPKAHDLLGTAGRLCRTAPSNQTKQIAEFLPPLDDDDIRGLLL